jgi:hypothetical protein
VDAAREQDGEDVLRECLDGRHELDDAVRHVTNLLHSTLLMVTRLT